MIRTPLLVLKLTCCYTVGQNYYQRCKLSVLVLLSLYLFFITIPAVHASGLEMFEDLQRRIVQVSNHIKHSVVHIEVLARRGEVRRKGLGSGLILSEDGLIVTNHHVIDKAQYITVILSDRSKYKAKVVRKDPQTDLALLKISPKRKLPAAVLADSDKVSVGEWVLAIGNPYGFDRTVSFGIISGKGRYIPGLDTEVPLLNDFIQTDALIDPGSSGGPLVNLKGEVIGINSVGIGRGQGFTIPSNVVKEVITRQEVGGRIERGWMGIYLQPFTREMAAFLGIPEVKGILVSDVQPGSPADRVGIRSGDVITVFNGEPVEAEQDEETNRFAQRVTALKPGTLVPLELIRNKRRIKLTITLGTQPPVDAPEIDTGLGVLVKDITQAAMVEYRLFSRRGVMVTYVSRGSAADEAGIKVGDVIVKIDSRSINDSKDLKEILTQIKQRKRAFITLKRGRLTHYALINLQQFSAPSP